MVHAPSVICVALISQYLHCLTVAAAAPPVPPVSTTPYYPIITGNCPIPLDQSSCEAWGVHINNPVVIPSHDPSMPPGCSYIFTSKQLFYNDHIASPQICSTHQSCVCNECAAGKRKELDSKVYRCVTCEAGMYQNDIANTFSCKACPAGTYLADASRVFAKHDAISDCLPCRAGWGSKKGSKNCLPNNDEWHTMDHRNGTFQSVEGVRFLRGDRNTTIQITVDHIRRDIVFPVQTMCTNNLLQIERATKFVDLHLADVEMYLATAIICSRECRIDNIVRLIQYECEKHIQSWGANNFAIKKRWRHGQNILYNRGSVNIAPALERYGEWEEPSIIVLQSLVSCSAAVAVDEKTSTPCPTIFDVGAHFGLFSLAMEHTLNVERLGGRREQQTNNVQLHSFEPQTHLANLISANAVLSGAARNIIVHNVGVGATRTIYQVPLVVDVESPAHRARFAQISLKSGYHAESLTHLHHSIQGITLDGVVFPSDPTTTVSIAPPQLIKIDVEGLELEVLQGARQIMLRHQQTAASLSPVPPPAPFVYFENHGGRNPKKIVHLLIDVYGYDRCYYHIFRYTRKENFMQDASWFKFTDASANMLCVPTPGWKRQSSGSTTEEESPPEAVAKALASGELVLMTERTKNGMDRICPESVAV